MKRIVLLLLVIFLFIMGCENSTNSGELPQNMSELEVSPEFSFATTSDVKINIY